MPPSGTDGDDGIDAGAGGTDPAGQVCRVRGSRGRRVEDRRWKMAGRYGGPPAGVKTEDPVAGGAAHPAAEQKDGAVQHDCRGVVNAPRQAPGDRDAMGREVVSLDQVGARPTGELAAE